MRIIWFYIYAAIRNLKGTRLMVNLAGLTLGVALSVFVLLFARYEMSWDKHFIDYNQIYRFASVVSIGNMQTLASVTPSPLRDVLSDQPEVEFAVRLYNGGKGIVEVQNQRHHESRFFYADRDFFNVFNLPFISGLPQTALDQKQDVVVTQSTAKKYFGHANPIGKQLKYNNKEYIVSAVVADVPINTHFHFDFIAVNDMNLAGLQDTLMSNRDESWLQISVYTYAKLRQEVDLDQFAQKINEIKDLKAAQQVEEVKELYRSPDETIVIDFVPEPITHIHYLSKAVAPIEPSIKFSYLVIFISLATLILFFIGINFSYVTATSSMVANFNFRSRLMMGATRFQVLLQLIIEMLVYSTLSVFVAMAIVELLLPMVNALFQLRMGLWNSNLHSMDVLFWVFLVFMASGIIPSLRIAYKNRLMDIRHNDATTHRFSWRGAVLFFQALLFAFLLFVVSGFGYQLHTLKSKDPGFNKERVMVIERGDLLDLQWQQFKTDLENSASVSKVAFAQSIPGQPHSTRSYRLSGSLKDPLAMLATNMVSGEYFEVMGLALKNGTFIGSQDGDTLAVMLNECAVHQYGIMKPVGERIEMDFDDGNDVKGMIVKGVIGNYHFEPYTQPIKPMVVMLSMHPRDKRYILIRINDDFNNNIRADIESVWKKYQPLVPLQMNPMSKYAEAQFYDDYRMLRIGLVLMFIALYVLLTGIFVYSDSLFGRHQYTLSVKQLCGASAIRLALEQSRHLFIILSLAVVLAFGLFKLVFGFYQENFKVIIDFPWLAIGAAASFSLLIPSILFIGFYQFFLAGSSSIHRLMKP